MTQRIAVEWTEEISAVLGADKQEVVIILYGKSISAGFALVLAVSFAALLAGSPSAMAQNTTADTTAEFYTPDFGVKGNVRQLTGPKRVLAVGKFNSMGAFRAFFGDWDEGGGVEAEDVDEMFDRAVAIVVETRNASISYVQRRLKIGYNRSARIIEQMEIDGMIGPQIGSKGREVFMPSAGGYDE